MNLKTQTRRSRLAIGFAVSVSVTAMSPQTLAGSITLGTAGDFAVLGGTTVINTGPSVINGNVGVSPGSAIVGFPPGTVPLPYTFHAADGVALQAQTDLTTAYNVAAGLAPTGNLTGQDLGGMTLVPGVYSFSSSALLTGTLTLDFQGNPDADFIFQIGSTLTTASGSLVRSINGGLSSDPGCNVFWQVGSSATLGTTTDFTGHIMALTSITLATGATLEGSALARNGAVTLDQNTITMSICADDETDTGGGGHHVPETASTLLLFGAGFGILACFKRATVSRA